MEVFCEVIEGFWLTKDPRINFSGNFSKFNNKNIRLMSLRSSDQRCSVKTAVLKIFAIFTGKHLCWSLFLIKLQEFRACSLIKKRLQNSWFPVNIAKYFRTPILNNIYERLLLIIDY